MNKIKLKLEQSISECQKHILRLEYAKTKMVVFMPISFEKYENLKNDEITYIDQFLYRFAKLQDVIGQKLIKYIYEFLGEEIENKSFIDIFNKLEQIGVIADLEKWTKLREIRNELSHDYGDDIKESVERLNIIYNMYDVLIEYYKQIVSYYGKLKM